LNDGLDAAPTQAASPIRDARALLRDAVPRLETSLPDGDPLITELRQILPDIGEE
jgi:hypothetical protein